ncbi:MAG: response regulator, partial [Desulfobacteraceae bacterium]
MAMKVLLAAAEEVALKTIKKCLVHDGYEVHTADNGVAASRMVETLLPDIVITDISMPEIGGVDLLRWIKKKNPDIEVIMITGHGELKLAIESLKMDAVDFITRPVNRDIVAIAMKRAVDRITTREQLALYTENLESLVREKTRELEAS